MRKTVLATAIVGALVIGAGVWAQQRLENNVPIEERLTSLERRVGLVQDVQEIYNLQNAYGYYVDKKLWDDVAALFTDDAVVEINARGVYKGDNIPNLFKGAMGGGVNGLEFGTINNHMQLQGVVHVDPSGLTANGRWRSFAQLGSAAREGRPGFAAWSEGPYEIAYRKVEGKWMFQEMRWDPTFTTNYNSGWDQPLLEGSDNEPVQGDRTSREFPPDEPPTRPIMPYPQIDTLPFHYPNPVTGEVTVIPPVRL